MRHDIIYIIVEGDDDELFFGRILRRCFRKRFPDVRIYQWSQKSKDEMRKLLNKHQSKEDEYIFIGDLEGPCISGTIDDLTEVFSELERERVFIVEREIEGWYLAGLGNEACQTLGIKEPGTTDGIGKRRFRILMKEGRFTSKNDFLMEIIKLYDLGLAKTRNTSLSRLLFQFQICIDNGH